MNADTRNIILRQRRIELHMTQQQVADKAGVHLRQYQRFENGERDVCNAGGKVMMSICMALKLDPYALLKKNDDKPEKKYVLLPPLMERGNEYYIPCQAYYSLVATIPRGMVSTSDQIFKRLRDTYGIQTLEILPDLYSIVMFREDCFPYWRVVEKDGYLVNSIHCSSARQKEKLQAEGVDVILDKELNTLCVDEFEFLNYDLNNVSLTVLDSRNRSE